MIGSPLNDHGCLGPTTALARDMVRARRAELAAIAAQFRSTHELAWWIQLKRQHDDHGLAHEGPKVYACRPPQRLRLFWDDPQWKTPNCYERMVEYIVIAEFIDGRALRQMATVNTRFGRHSLPFENNRAVVLDPAMTRNELEGAMFELDRRPLRVTRNEAIDWLATLAEEPAAANGEAHRVRNARVAMRRVMSGAAISSQAVADIAYTVDEADREAMRFGARGQALHRRAAEGLTHALIAQRRRNAADENQELENLLDAGLALLKRQIAAQSANASGASAAAASASSPASSSPATSAAPSKSASAAPQSQLGKVGVGNPLLRDLEQVAGGLSSIASTIGGKTIKQGLTIGGTAIGGPAGGAIGSLAGDALIALGLRNAAGLRNASWIAVKTPGTILDEINTTNGDIMGLDADITDTFQQRFAAQQQQAAARFAKDRGRQPESADLAQVYGLMQPVPSQADIDAKSYHSAFVAQWRAFVDEWKQFVGDHEHWYDRMWRGSYDKAIEYREQALGWRKKFQALGGVPTAPAPHIPEDRDKNDDPDNPKPQPKGPWNWILLVAGLGAAALVLPGVIRAFRS